MSRFATYWKGASVEHPGAALWSTDPGEAARFSTVDDVAAALEGLISRYKIVGFQHCLW
ncbi:hypothetical protein AB0F91_43010 [Amycolatopsis sp. NPDC023774]|uniref:hypothetical protein n=1 Tax=Amycolatopsis sp. NPDC023774 TaxID=3155015 RepID=UPI0033CEBF93